ncbi:hypothetical protein JZ751_023812 [Albula glossodonta]|uniref:DUF1977 domain-containing protein n=1 Tax=Albula glossodonta TaxID=121402 RepID=A0A8T2NPC0_9TELE|nr:hypothetical protein JZ751_023812 [Albula glossodonta]
MKSACALHRFSSSAVAMESNRDEAERCFEIAITALRNSQTIKAQRFLEKAYKLFPSDKTKGNVHVYSNGRMRYTYSQRPERREQQGDGGLALFVQLMPILFLIVVSALSQMMVSSPPYSLSIRPSVGHTLKRLTGTLKVPYYVSEHFAEEYTGINLKNVERSVEDDYISNLRNNCWKEKQQSKTKITNTIHLQTLPFCVYIYCSIISLTCFSEIIERLFKCLEHR